MISIILCTYNRAHTLKTTIDSILGQTYREFDLWIIDDGSTDSTQQILQEYEDERIRLITLEENQYYCAAANYGLTLTNEKYIAFATSDDVWEPEKLELQLHYLEARPECGGCFTFSDVIDEQGRSAKEDFEMLSGLLVKKFYNRKDWIEHFIFEGNCLCHPSAVIRKDVLDDVGGFNLLYCQAADMELWLRIVRKYPIHVIEKNLVHYRCYRNPEAQVSGANDLKAARFVNEHMIIRKNFINSLSDREMVEFFGEHFRNPDAGTHLEMEIEKAFLLMNCARGLPDFRILGIEKLEEVLRLPGAVETLKKTYHVGLKDIYEWNLGHFYMDFGIHVRMDRQDRKVLVLKEKLRKEKAYTKGLEKYRNEMTDSLEEAATRLRERDRELERRAAKIEEVRAEREKIRAEKEKIKEEAMETDRQWHVMEMAVREKEKEVEEAEGLLREALMQRLAAEEALSKIQG